MSEAVRIPFLVPDWPAAPQVRAAFTLRGGGVSLAPCDTLNLGAHTGDDPQAVLENRRRIATALGLPSEPCWLQQVHGTQVLEISSPGTAEGSAVPPTADAALTRRPGRVPVVLVADCLAVLLSDAAGTVVAVAHAGWRGLAGGVLAATVDRMGVAPPELLAWISPGISQAHYEVGKDVRAAMLAADEALEGAFRPNARGRWQCDLGAIARARLAALGVTRLYGGQGCTFAERERFFSFRRDGRCGRMAALIWLAG